MCLMLKCASLSLDLIPYLSFVVLALHMFSNCPEQWIRNCISTILIYRYTSVHYVVINYWYTFLYYVVIDFEG